MYVEWAIPPWGWVVLLLVAILLWLWTRRQYSLSEPRLSGSLRRWLIGLRALSLIGLLLAVAGPTIFRTWQRSRPAEIVVLLEDSGSMNLADSGPGTTRWQRALGLAAAVDSLLQGRSEPVSVSFFQGNGIQPSRGLSLAVDELASPTAVGTDLAELVRQVNAHWSDRPLRGVILISDGNSTATGSPAPGAGLAGTAPLLTVGVGDPAGPSDRFIQDLRYPEVAFQGDKVVIEVAVGSLLRQPAPDAGIEVFLKADDRIVAQAEAVAEEQDGSTRLELELHPEAAGLQVYELEISPLANERYLSNNRASLAINVRKDRSRLLLLATRPGWDVRFLAQAAQKEERLQATVAYRTREGFVLADSVASWSFPQRVEEWLEWDGVVLVGLQDLLPVVNWPSLRDAARAGLGILVLTGARDAPDDRRLVAGALTDELKEMLPVRLQGAAWRSGEWRPSPTAEGGQHTILTGVTHQVTSGGELSSGRLPPLIGLLDVALKPGSIPLLAAVPLRGEGEALQRPLLVLGAPSEGRVAWFGGRRLWELAFWEPPVVHSGGEDQPARRLLRNLLVWVASGEEESGLAMVGHRTVFQEGERIRLESEWRDVRGAPVTDRSVVLSVESLDAQAGFTERTYTMERISGKAGHAQVVLPPLPPGRYRIRPQTAGEPLTVGRDHALVIAPQSIEAAQVRQDSRRLRQLAAGNGTYVAGEASDAIDRLQSALAGISLTGDEHLTRRQWHIWSGWIALVVIVLLLTCEWTLRRRQGLL